MKIKALSPLTVMILFFLLLTGCGKDNFVAVSMYDLSKEMIAADSSLPEMITVSTSDTDAENNFKYLSDMDYTKVDSYFLSYSAEGKADEIVVIAVKNVNDVEETKKTLEAHVKSRKNVYDTYDPTQLQRVDQALIFTQSHYAVLIISDDAPSVKNAFMNFLQVD